MKITLIYFNIALFIVKDFIFYFLNILYSKMSKNYNHDEIDIVFSWVDGDDPEHQRKKKSYLYNDAAFNDIEDKAIKDYRWSNNNELIIALKSIYNFCPWVNKIWIITDNQTPNIYNFPENFKSKITIVDHKEIFQGYNEFLPTFNSRTIETFLWRIQGLSEKFIYLNDDMFFLKPVNPTDFFILNNPVLRGNYRASFNKNLTLHQQGILSGSMISGFKKDIFFRQGHAPYVLIKSQLEKLFNEYREIFEKNIEHKFRSREQFLSVSLFYHCSLLNYNCVVNFKKDYLHLSEAVCKNANREELIKLLKKTNQKKYKFLCINDLGSLKKKVPDYKKYLSNIE